MQNLSLFPMQGPHQALISTIRRDHEGIRVCSRYPGIRQRNARGIYQGVKVSMYWGVEVSWYFDTLVRYLKTRTSLVLIVKISCYQSFRYLGP